MKQLLKFLTCGSVDDGKSTLIGHMLYDAKLIFADQKQALELESQVGSAGGAIDYSLLLDGLQAEHEQGITIDVAYRYFSTKRRSFIVADSPGHEEYTRNMAVGASFADLAVILLDATKGILSQTRRHTRICALCGIQDFVFAVNKMDLVDFDHEVFSKIETAIRDMVAEYPIHTLSIIPTSASTGDNLTHASVRTPWFEGLPLLDYLETVEPLRQQMSDGFCLPIQRVSRPDRTFRGFQGQIAMGKIQVGDAVTVLPSGEEAHVSRIIAAGEDTQEAMFGQPVSVCLDREVDVSRGCVIVRSMKPYVTDRFACTMLWFDDEPLVPWRSYLLKVGTATIPAMVTKIRHGVDINTGQQQDMQQLTKNGIALVEMKTNQPVVVDAFSQAPMLGELILIDRVSHATSACGVVEFPLGVEGSVIEQELSVTRQMREQRNGHRAFTVWLTGLSGAGKSTLADAVERKLFARGVRTMVLDGDNVRMGLNANLGFSAEDRAENIRRVSEAAKLLNDAGVVVLTAFISPFRADRENARKVVGEDAFVEVHVSTPVEECERRDVKGLYAKARRGEIREFTGVSSPYEPPEAAHVVLNTANATVEESADALMRELERYLVLD
ncbi:MAG: adenylyl-sulfate kinase [Eggerthellaceae bacterium]|nr:adenylyl-sulfate kinase [Eggerthellaceae bacterium]